LAQFVRSLVAALDDILDDFEEMGVGSDAAARTREIWELRRELVLDAAGYIGAAPGEYEGKTEDDPTLERLEQVGLTGPELVAKLEGYYAAEDRWREARSRTSPRTKRRFVKGLLRWGKAILSSIREAIQKDPRIALILEALGEFMDLVSNRLDDIDDIEDAEADS
jgi:hypothetical protein